MNYSDIKKFQWFELLITDSNPYDYKRYLYNTGIKIKGKTLYIQIHKNNLMRDYNLDLDFLPDVFWINKSIDEIEYKDPPKPIKKVNRFSIKKIFEELP